MMRMKIKQTEKKKKKKKRTRRNPSCGPGGITELDTLCDSLGGGTFKSNGFRTGPMDGCDCKGFP